VFHSVWSLKCENHYTEVQCKWELYNYINKQPTVKEVTHSMPLVTSTLDIKMGSMLWKKSKLSNGMHKIHIFHTAYV